MHGRARLLKGTTKEAFLSYHEKNNAVMFPHIHIY